MVLSEPDAVEAELLGPHHLLDLPTDDVGVRNGRRSLEEVVRAETHGDRDSTSCGREDHLAVKIDQERRVIARMARARPDALAPFVADVQEPRPGGGVDERLVEPETVASVWRIP